jgi:hypothetical protein
MTLVGRLIEGWLIGGWIYDNDGKGWLTKVG